MFLWDFSIICCYIKYFYSALASTSAKYDVLKCFSISELLFTISILVLAQPQFPSQSSKTRSEVIPVWIPLEFLCSIGMCWCANRSSAGPVRAKQQQWSASACYNAWCSSKERKINPGVFLRAFIQNKCSMSEGRFITYPKKKLLLMMKTWLGDVGARLTSAPPWQQLPSRPWSIRLFLKKSWKEEKGTTKNQQSTFWRKKAEMWASGAACPSLGSALKGYKSPQRESLGGFSTLPRANAPSPCQVSERRQENSSHTWRKINKTGG